MKTHSTIGEFIRAVATPSMMLDPDAEDGLRIHGDSSELDDLIVLVRDSFDCNTLFVAEVELAPDLPSGVLWEVVVPANVLSRNILSWGQMARVLATMMKANVLAPQLVAQSSDG